MTRKRAAMLFALLACAGLLAGCGGAAPAPEESGIAYRAVPLDPGVAYNGVPLALGPEGQVLFARENGDHWEIQTVQPDPAGQDYSAVRLPRCDSVRSFFALPDGGVVFLYTAGDMYRAARYDGAGTALFDTALWARSDRQYVDAAVSPEGEVYIIGWAEDSGEYSLTALSGDGEVRFTLSRRETVTGICLLNGEMPLLLVDGDTLLAVDTDKRSWGERRELDGTYLRLYGGGDDVVYLDSGKALTACDYARGSLVRLPEWSALLIQPPQWLAPAGEGFVLLSGGQLYSLLPAEAGEADGAGAREVITLATSNAAWVLAEAAAFNAANDRYVIEVEEYTPDNMDLLYTQLMAGDGPDIFHYSMNDLFTEELPSSRLAAAGYLTDLYTFLDADGELSRESFLPNVLDAAAQGGSLYELPYRFWIDIVAGPSALLGTEPGWTMEEMRGKLSELDFDGYLFGPSIRRDIVLELCLSYNMSDFLDWSSGTCRFYSPEFQELLTFVRNYAPADNSSNRETELAAIRNGKQLLMRQKVGAKNALQIFDFYFGDSVLIGFPTPSGVGNAIVYDGSFAISATAEQPQAAWDFVRQFYTREYYESAGFYVIPTNLDALEFYYGIKEEGSAFQVGAPQEAGSYQLVFADTTEEDIRRMRELIASLDRVYRVDVTISEIIREAALPFFAGDKSVQDVTEIIQSRAESYVREQF